MEIICFKHVNVAYETTNVLHEIDLCIKEGEHTAILGANGSGKTTLINAIINVMVRSVSITTIQLQLI